MEFMKTEGDRSGVEIPDRNHKAANIIHAMIEQLQGKEIYSIEEIDAAFDALTRARFQLKFEK